MKRLFLISAMFTGISCFAQTNCNSSNALFNFDMATGMPTEIHRLGTSPEFPFLRNMSSARQVASAIKRNDEKNTTGMSELNEMLTSIGFTNGAKDVGESNISMYYIPYGTDGNMGNGMYSTQYCKLNVGDGNGIKSWKISSGTGCYMLVLSKCGNAFYPKTENKTACLDVPVNVSGDMTLNATGQTATTTNDVYIYYAKKWHKRRHETAHPIADIADAYPSTPLLLNTTKDVESVPQTYKLTVNTPDNTVKVCPDSTLNLTANINVEKSSEYSGYYPAATAKKVYKKVSKRIYRRTARKMRKAKRKEARVARMTGITVNESVAANK